MRVLMRAEDAQGDFWLVRDKCGRCRYDGRSLLSRTEGRLCASLAVKVCICFVSMKSAFRLLTGTHMKQGDSTKLFKQGGS